MKILVFGAGALGSLFGGLLACKYDVTFVGNKKHMHAVKTSGLRITGKTNLLVKPSVIEPASISKQKFELVLLTVKSYDTVSAMKTVRKTVSSNAVILTLQNGLDNVEKIMKFVKDRNKIFAGVTSHGVTFVSPGVIKHAGVGETVIGCVGEDGRRLKLVADAFNSVGIKTLMTKDIHSAIWQKAIVNAAINPLTAILRVPNGYLLQSKLLEKIVVEICSECVAVVNAVGLNFEKTSMVEKTKTVIRQTAANKSSMLQDIERGKRTEIDSINGAIVKIADKHKIPVPYNRLLVALVKSIEAKGCNPG